MVYELKILDLHIFHSVIVVSSCMKIIFVISTNDESFSINILVRIKLL